MLIRKRTIARVALGAPGSAYFCLMSSRIRCACFARLPISGHKSRICEAVEKNLLKA